METLGVPAPKGGLKWRPGTLTRILKDKALIGEFYAYKEKMVGEGGRVKKRREYQKNGWQGITETELAGVLLVVIGIIALVGCILSWKNLRLASILLIVSSAALGVHIGSGWS